MAATEPTNPQRSWMRLDGVDLLRGLAILFVLLNHVNMRLLGAKIPYTKGLPSQLVDSLVWNGQFGVQMFFAISGFLITSTTLRRWTTLAAINVRDFYLLRIARIAPLLLLLLAILSTLHLAHITSFVVSPKTGGLTALLASRIRFGLPTLRIIGAIGNATLIFILCLSDHVNRWGLGRNGLSMSILAIGTCMVILAAAQSQWKSPALLAPLRKLGQHSYEIYLTHIFLVIPLFTLFLAADKPMRAIPALFLAVILLAPILGELVARLYSEPLNRTLRRKFGDSPSKLGSVIDSSSPNAA